MVLRVLLVAAVVLPAAACRTPSCAQDEEVRYTSRGDWVCVPVPATAESASSATPPASAAPTPSCPTVVIASSPVVVAPRAGAPDDIPDGAPPNGTYRLVEATWFTPDASAPPVGRVRAALRVDGALLVVAARDELAVGAAPDEAIEIAAGGTVLTTLCESSPGPFAGAFFPSETGATRPARFGWDPTSARATLAIATLTGQIHLVFTP